MRESAARWIGYGPNMLLEYIHTASLHILNSEVLIIASKAFKVKNCFCFCPHWEDYGLRTGLLSNRGEVTVSNQARLSKGSVCNTSEFEARKCSSYSWLFSNWIITEGGYFRASDFLCDLESRLYSIWNFPHEAKRAWIGWKDRWYNPLDNLSSLACWGGSK